MSTCYMLFVLINVAITVVAQTDSCSEGTYGANCELTCPDQCRPLQTFPCDKRTGQCYEGCNNGYYGDQCDKQCFCPSGICYQETGECYQTGAVTEIITQKTTYRVEEKLGASVHTPVCDGVSAGWRTAAALLTVIIIIMIGVVVGMLLYRRWGMKQSSHTASGTNQRRFVDIFLHFPCIGGRDRGSDEQSEKEPLETATARPIQEEHDVEAADDQRETQIQTQDRRCDPPVIELRQQQTGDNEELRQRINELEQEKHKKEEDCRFEKNQMEEEYKQEKRQMIDKHEQEKRQMEEKYITEQNETLKNLGLPTNSAYHLMKRNIFDQPLWIQCPYMKFDKERVNVKVAQVDDKMVLWNIPDPRNPGDNSSRFHQFSGTTCTDPLVRTGFYQYFEAIFNIDLKRSFGEGEVVMQLAFCEEKDQDGNTFIQGNTNTFVLKVVGCNAHKKICLVCTKGGKTDHVQPSMMNNSPGSKTEVNIGVRLNQEMKRLAVYNLRLLKMLKITDINIGKRSWPMFGLSDQREASVHVELQAGRDIKMWDEKIETLKKKDN